jgi:hypothetical protein
METPFYCLVRVPRNIHSKNGQKVHVVKRWNSKRPAIKWIKNDFMEYLIQKRIDKIEDKRKKKD